MPRAQKKTKKSVVQKKATAPPRDERARGGGRKLKMKGREKRNLASLRD